MLQSLCPFCQIQLFLAGDDVATQSQSLCRRVFKSATPALFNPNFPALKNVPGPVYYMAAFKHVPDFDIVERTSSIYDFSQFHAKNPGTYYMYKYMYLL